MKANDRSSFTIKRKKWWRNRDKNTCQAPFAHTCTVDQNLTVHHIKPHGYLGRVAPEVSADFPENAITICQNAHDLIHPDAVWARSAYHLHPNSFLMLRTQRNDKMDRKEIYWNGTWDRMMEVIALINTQAYIKKHPFPVYKARKKHEIIKDTED